MARLLKARRLLLAALPACQACARGRPRQCSTSTNAPRGRAQQLDPVISQYRDRRFDGTQEQFEECLKSSTTLYVGNLSFYTTEEQIYEARPRQQ